MMSSLPDPEPQYEPPEPRSRWGIADLVVFCFFFGLTLLLLPFSVIRVWQVFNPNLRVSDLTAIDQVLLQALMNVVLVGFIAFLVKVVHRESFVATVHWYRNYEFSSIYLLGLGSTLAISVLIVSSLFPPSAPPPIERLLSTPSAMYIFAVFGIGVAPLFEEIIFRGFVFKVLSDVGGAAAAVFVTAALFALLHIPQLWGSWAGIALIFVVGYVLSVVRMRSNSVIPTFIIHTAYNATLFGVFAVSSFVQKGTG